MVSDTVSSMNSGELKYKSSMHMKSSKIHILIIYKGADVENHLMSFERIMEYCQLEPETQPEIAENVPDDWPSKGKVEFKDVSYRYSTDGEPVLRGLTFSVKAKEKIRFVHS